MSTQQQNPQQRRRLVGGSAAEENADEAYNSVISLFGKGVDFIRPGSKKLGIMARFKPSLNYSLDPGDPAFPTSMVPFRNAQDLDEEGVPKFTPWFNCIRTFSFVGNGKLSFVSPMTRPADSPEIDKACPLTMIIRFCKDKPQYAHFIAKQEITKANPYGKAILEWADTNYIYNAVYVSAEIKTPTDGLLLLGRGGHTHMVEQLKAARPAEMPQNLIDVNWPQYLLGDITDPARGLLANIKQVQVGNNNNHPWSPVFTNQIGWPAGMQQYALTEKQIANRYDLLSEDVVRIEPFQRIVEILLNDGFLPRDLIAGACGGMCDIPGGGHAQPTYHNAQTGGQFAAPSDDDIPMNYPPAAAPQGFGAPPPQPNAFGGGVPAPQTFGAPAPQGFGAPAPAPQQSFAPSAFGAPAPAPAPQQGFGQPGGFGAPAPQQGFGAPAPQQGFGQPGGFSAPAPQQGFGQPGGFSAPAPQQGFGAPAPQQGFGAPASSPLGHGGSSFAPPPAAPPAPQAAPPPAPAPITAADLYHVALNGQTLPKPMTLADIQAQGIPLTAHLCNVLSTTEGWKPLTNYLPAATQQAAPPPAAPPAAPTGFVNPSANVQPLTPAEMEEWKALDQKCLHNVAAMSGADYTRLGDLGIRAAAHQQSVS